jgi:hypothetical protein
VLLCLSLPPLPNQAKTLYDKGSDAEARQNYEQAYDYYKASLRAQTERSEVSRRL